MIDIILLEPEHEGNVGAVCRVMANFGFFSLVIVNPKCDLDKDEFYRRAKHSKGKIQINIVSKFPKYDILVGTTARINTDYNVDRSAVLCEELPSKLVPAMKKSRIGVLFGREGIGLKNEEIQKCDFVVTINSSKEYSTLNLSHAVAIILYELHKKMKTAKIADQIEPMHSVDKKQLLKMINSIIDDFDFQSSYKKDLQKKMWKNVFSKAVLTRREAFGIMGLLGKVKKRISK